jgi:hypothetical protein
MYNEYVSFNFETDAIKCFTVTCLLVYRHSNPYSNLKTTFACNCALSEDVFYDGE